jgi:glycosyltransferase domain-containing protein
MTDVIKSNVTIVLPLKDRIPYTLRWMNYANVCKLPFKILIADGGKENNLQNILTKESYPNLDFEYLRYPFDRSFSEYYSKLVDVVSKVETPFVVMADNDQFPIKIGIEASADFLQKNSDYIACAGKSVSCTVRDHNGHSSLQGKVRFTLIRQDKSIEFNTARERIVRQFSNHILTYYDVHRTNVLLDHFRILRILDIKDVYLAEEFLTIWLVASGKIKRVPELSLVRQTNTTSANPIVYGQNDALSRMFIESWSKDFYGYIEVVAEVANSIDKTSLDENKKLIRECHMEQFVRNFKSRLNVSLISLIKKKVFLLNKNSLLWKIIYWLYTTYERFVDSERSSLNHNTSIFSPDLKQIRRICEKNYVEDILGKHQEP